MWRPRETSDRQVGIAPLQICGDDTLVSLVSSLVTTLMLLPKGALYFGTHKHDSVVKVLRRVYHLDRHLVKGLYSVHGQAIKTNHHAVHRARYGSDYAHQGTVWLHLGYGGGAVGIANCRTARRSPRILTPQKGGPLIP